MLDKEEFDLELKQIRNKDEKRWQKTKENLIGNGLPAEEKDVNYELSELWKLVDNLKDDIKKLRKRVNSLEKVIENETGKMY